MFHIWSFLLVLNVIGLAASPLSLERKKLASAVSQAHEKIKLRDRNGAIEILLDHIQRESSGDLKSILLNELSKTTDLFFTNEGQKNYELAESIRFSGKQGHAAKYDLALEQEGNNFKVIKGKALSLISASNCKQAKIFLEDKGKWNPYDHDLLLLQLKAEICVNSDVKLAEINFNLLKGQMQAVYYHILNAQKYSNEKKSELALTAARAAIKLDSDYPSGYFWAWKAIADYDNNTALDEAQKYLNLCRDISSNLRRKYYLDANLCQDLESVEEYIKKVESQLQ